MPVSIIISLLTGPFLDGEPFLVQKVVFVTLLVVVLTWVVMPWMSRVAAGFLYPEGEGAQKEVTAPIVMRLSLGIANAKI
ncbi:MAG: hypothetical protein PHF39_03400 [Methanoregula sp.]|nr:hypothetical protein [Methanoregula sp.]